MRGGQKLSTDVVRPPYAWFRPAIAVAGMDEILLTRALRDQGFTYDEVVRLRHRGDLHQIRRGAYAVPGESSLDREALHRRLIHATVPQLVDGAVVSHHSAAVLHGLPVWLTQDVRVHVTRLGEGNRRVLLHVNPAPLADDEIVLVDGIAVTSVARTVLDLARTRSMEQAVAAADHALRAGLPLERFAEGLGRMRRWPGVCAARRVVDFSDPRAETVGESISRVRILRDGLPKPDLQVEIVGAFGEVIARVDFYWPEFRTAGEFDGKVKYGRLLTDGQKVEDVLVREDAVRGEGHEMARWIWEDCWQRDVIGRRVRAAFARQTRPPRDLATPTRT